MRIIKLVLIAFAILASSLGSTTSGAHPLDSDGLYYIGVGTKLTLINDINILPNTYMTMLTERKEYDSQYYYCVLVSDTVGFDRIIQAGTVYTIRNIDNDWRNSSNSGRLYTISLDSANFSIQCSASDNITIGEFKFYLSRVAQVDLAPPVVVR